MAVVIVAVLRATLGWEIVMAVLRKGETCVIKPDAYAFYAVNGPEIFTVIDSSRDYFLLESVGGLSFHVFRDDVEPVG